MLNLLAAVQQPRAEQDVERVGQRHGDGQVPELENQGQDVSHSAHGVERVERADHQSWDLWERINVTREARVKRGLNFSKLTRIFMVSLVAWSILVL